MFFSVKINAALLPDDGRMETTDIDGDLFSGRELVVTSTGFDVKFALEHVQDDMIRMIMGRIDHACVVMANMDMMKPAALVFFDEALMVGMSISRAVALRHKRSIA